MRAPKLLLIDEPSLGLLELAGQMRIVDVFDPDGNRVQLAQHFE